MTYYKAENMVLETQNQNLTWKRYSNDQTEFKTTMIHTLQTVLEKLHNMQEQREYK